MPPLGRIEPTRHTTHTGFPRGQGWSFNGLRPSSPQWQSPQQLWSIRSLITLKGPGVSRRSAAFGRSETFAPIGLPASPLSVDKGSSGGQRVGGTSGQLIPPLCGQLGRGDSAMLSAGFRLVASELGGDRGGPFWGECKVFLSPHLPFHSAEIRAFGGAFPWAVRFPGCFWQPFGVGRSFC